MILLSLLMIGYILWTLTNFGLLYEGNKSAWPVELTRSFEFLDDAEYDMLVFTPFLLAWFCRIVDALVLVIKSLPRILILNKWFPMSTTHVLMLKSVPMILVYNVKFGCIYSNQYVRIKNSIYSNLFPESWSLWLSFHKCQELPPMALLLRTCYRWLDMVIVLVVMIVLI